MEYLALGSFQLKWGTCYLDLGGCHLRPVWLGTSFLHLRETCWQCWVQQPTSWPDRAAPLYWPKRSRFITGFWFGVTPVNQQEPKENDREKIPQLQIPRFDLGGMGGGLPQ